MAYVVPSVLIYQQLAGNAGVANVTPDLDACIIGPCYNVVPYVAGSSSNLITSAAVTVSGAAASISNNAVTNTVYLGSTKVGQIVDPTSVKVYLNSARVETKVMYGTGTAGNNTLNFSAYTGTGTSSIGSATITGVTNATQLNVGDIITIAGAGVAAAALVSTIVSISGTTVTISDTASSVSASAAITRTSFNNVNPNSATLRAEAGDIVVITYGSTVFTTGILSTTGTNNLVTSILLTDLLPVGITVPFTVSIRKIFNNLLLPASFNAYTNYTISTVTTDGSIVINPLPKVSYGTVVTGNINAPYKALRRDLVGLLEISSIDDQIGVLGEATDDNPLALGVQIALANTTGRIMAVAVDSNDLAGYVSVLEFLEEQRVYALVPLTQDTSILAAVQAHVHGMSTPENAAWRIGLFNTAIPSITYIGSYNPNLVNANSGNNTVTFVSGSYVLTASNAQFVSDGVVPGDVVKVTSHTAAAQVITSMTVLEVLNNQQLKVNVPIVLTAVNYYVQRNLSRSEQAQYVATMSESFLSGRILHIQPDLVGVSVGGVTKYLPGYYMACAISGLTSGLPSQQSLTNVGVAGITDLQHSNRYFTRAQLSTISAGGTFLLVQEAAGTIPYIRHSLTTDMSVLQYRELQQVKNVDFISYFFHDILKSFPGRYNITPDTLQILRTTIVAGAKLLQGKKLPKIGPPLLDYNITTLKQDPVNKDNIIVEMPISIPTVANYINIYLIY